MSAPYWAALVEPVAGDLAGTKAVDPYLLWAWQTTLASVSETELLPFLVETASAHGVSQPLAYWTKFDTRFIAKSAVFNALTADAQVVRFQLSLARRSAINENPSVVNKGSLSTLETIGVIDDGCCLAHRDLRGPDLENRFLGVWDQSPLGSEVGLGWNINLPPYGMELSAAAINVVLGQAHPTERMFYGAINRCEWLDAGRSHGAKVLHLLCGRGGYHGLPPPLTPGAASSTAKILFVQLPLSTVEDASGGSLGFYVLDGARYIVARTKDQIPAEQVTAEGMWKTTINISLGSIAGPHDGTTMTEQALDELVERFPGRVQLVMAAGNTGHKGVHAQADLEVGGAATFSVMVPPALREESFVEFWVTDAARDQIQLTVTPPDATDGATLGFGEATALHDGNGRIAAALVAPMKVAQGLNGSMALLALRPTHASVDATAPYGVWTVKIESTIATTVHAWVERNETIIGRRSGQRVRFVPGPDPSSGQRAVIQDASTLSSIANGKQPLVIGGYTRSNHLPAADGARGPVRESTAIKPDCLAPSSESPWLRGLRVPGFLSGSTSRISGSSAAAPLYARALVDGEVQVMQAPSGEPPLLQV